MSYASAKALTSEHADDLWAILVSGENPDGTPFTLPTAAQSALAELWSDGTLIGVSGAVVSGWVNVASYKDLRILRTAAGGTYAFEVDWGRATGVADITETVVVANNTSVSKPVGATWARFRVRNTDAVTAFTAHRTTVSGV